MGIGRRPIAVEMGVVVLAECVPESSVVSRSGDMEMALCGFRWFFY